MPTKLVLWCDNTSVVALTANLILHWTTKHIDLNCHFIQDRIEQKQLNVQHVPSYDQTVNILTKHLSPEPLQFLRGKLSGTSFEVVQIP